MIVPRPGAEFSLSGIQESIIRLAARLAPQGPLEEKP